MLYYLEDLVKDLKTINDKTKSLMFIKNINQKILALETTIEILKKYDKRKENN